MRAFTLTRPENVAGAAKLLSQEAGTQLIAGGTNLVDLMKENVARPQRLVDVNRLPLDRIQSLPDGGLRIGALVTNADAAWNKEIETRYPLLSQAILAGASPQIRNMATTGGNLMQRTRCWYFYDTATPCNKRQAGSGCSALHGYNRMHAILGASEHCVAVHPSDMCAALAALDAIVQVEGPKGPRAIPFTEFHRLPGDDPQRDTNLAHDEVITSVDLPPKEFQSVAYLKVRDRASYAFALVSAAAALEMNGGHIGEARLALGGVAHKPWRDVEAERLLRGEKPTRESFQKVADAVLKEARPHEHNAFKVELAKRVIVRAFSEAAQAGQS
jgi:xanthine dehydrogenase YagS FAD-binding subunit